MKEALTLPLFCAQTAKRNINADMNANIIKVVLSFKAIKNHPFRFIFSRKKRNSPYLENFFFVICFIF
jgi:hypothetical protein